MMRKHIKQILFVSATDFKLVMKDNNGWTFEPIIAKRNRQVNVPKLYSRIRDGELCIARNKKDAAKVLGIPIHKAPLEFETIKTRLPKYWKERT
jgi:hypothetical protein